MIRINLKKPGPASFILPSGLLVLGVYLIFDSSNKKSFIDYLITVVAVSAILLAWGSLKALKNRYFDKESGLQIDYEKLIYQPNQNQNSIIYWSDIKEIKFKSQSTQPFILLIIKDPEMAIASQTNKIGKRVMKIYLKLYKTPILINASHLDYNFKNLKKLLVDRFNSTNGKESLITT